MESDASPVVADTTTNLNVSPMIAAVKTTTQTIVGSGEVVSGGVQTDYAIQTFPFWDAFGSNLEASFARIRAHSVERLESYGGTPDHQGGDDGGDVELGQQPPPAAAAAAAAGHQLVESGGVQTDHPLHLSPFMAAFRSTPPESYARIRAHRVEPLESYGGMPDHQGGDDGGDVELGQQPPPPAAAAAAAAGHQLVVPHEAEGSPTAAAAEAKRILVETMSMMTLSVTSVFQLAQKLPSHKTLSKVCLVALSNAIGTDLLLFGLASYILHAHYNNYSRSSSWMLSLARKMVRAAQLLFLLAMLLTVYAIVFGV